MQLRILAALSIFTLGVNAQAICDIVSSTVSSEVVEMNSFNNRVPAPSPTNPTDCSTGTRLKSGIDGFRATALTAGCAGVYANAVLATGFNAPFLVLSQFVAKC